MRRITLLTGAMLVLAAFVLGRLSAQDADTGPDPSCNLCPADHVPAEEIAAYERVAMETGLTDLQVRSIDIGKSNVQVALVHRGPLEAPRPQSVASHDLVTEVYYVLSGGGTNLTGADLIDKQRRPPDNRAVQFLNGPGNNSAGVRDGAAYELEAGGRSGDPCGHRTPVHADRRPHHLSHGASGSGQGGAVDGCRGVAGVPGGERSVVKSCGSRVTCTARLHYYR